MGKRNPKSSRSSGKKETMERILEPWAGHVSFACQPCLLYESNRRASLSLAKNENISTLKLDPLSQQLPAARMRSAGSRSYTLSTAQRHLWLSSCTDTSVFEQLYRHLHRHVCEQLYRGVYCSAAYPVANKTQHPALVM
eukprot:881553-Pelagomonas_calceolata.AAC.1